MPSLRRSTRRVFAESASLSPFTGLPASLNPVYSKTGIQSSDVFLGDAQDFSDAGLAGQHLLCAVLQQSVHPLAHRGLLDGSRVDVLEHQLPDVVVHQKKLIDSASAAVAVLPAARTTTRFVDLRDAGPLHPLLAEANFPQLLLGGLIGNAAIGAQPSHQPLRQDCYQGR